MNDAILVTDAMGGATATAKFFGIEQPSVSEWRSRGVIPRARLRHLQDVKPEVLPAHLRQTVTKTDGLPPQMAQESACNKRGVV